MRKFIGLTLIFATIFMAHPLLANTNDRIKAKFMVDLAINHYASATDKAVAFENISDPDGKFRDNDIYMFVFNPVNRVMHAHGANMDFIGKPQLAKVGDKMLVDEIAAIAKPYGAWYSYEWQNPSTNIVKAKPRGCENLTDLFLAPEFMISRNLCLIASRHHRCILNECCRMYQV